MSSKVYRYTIELGPNGDCAWTPTTAVSFNESPQVVVFDPHQAIYDLISRVRSTFSTIGLQERLALLEELFVALIKSPDFLAANTEFATEINRVCWNLLHDVYANKHAYMVYHLSLCFI